MGTMIANAMFYGQDEVKPAFQIQIGPIIINSTTLQISIYGTLVTMPASMALLTIFKKAKPKESIIGPANMDAATKVKHTRNTSGRNSVEISKFSRWKRE